ncbi:hypothetical protein HKX48_000459 [Thoreauomyces humboldtii]|nr:hypothetical protein HKX48_000459 [Thoreauomyces humboldtii]
MPTNTTRQQHYATTKHYAISMADDVLTDEDVRQEYRDCLTQYQDIRNEINVCNSEINAPPRPGETPVEKTARVAAVRIRKGELLVEKAAMQKRLGRACYLFNTQLPSEVLDDVTSDEEGNGPGQPKRRRTTPVIPKSQLQKIKFLKQIQAISTRSMKKDLEELEDADPAWCPWDGAQAQPAENRPKSADELLSQFLVAESAMFPEAFVRLVGYYRLGKTWITDPDSKDAFEEAMRTRIPQLSKRQHTSFVRVCEHMVLCIDKFGWGILTSPKMLSSIKAKTVENLSVQNIEDALTAFRSHERKPQAGNQAVLEPFDSQKHNPSTQYDKKTGQYILRKGLLRPLPKEVTMAALKVTEAEYDEICNAIIKRVYGAKTKGKEEAKNRYSTIRSFVKNNILQHIKNPPVMLASIKTFWPKSSYTRENKTKAISQILKHATLLEKRSLLLMNDDEDWDQDHFEKEIHFFYKKKDSVALSEKQERETSQTMTPLDLENYVPVKEINRVYIRERAKLNPDNIIENQMIVLLGMRLNADILLRGECGMAGLDPDMCENYFEEDKLHIRNQSKKSDCDLVTYDYRVLPFIHMLRDRRIELGHDYLFMKKASKTGNYNPTKNWVDKQFGEKMEKLFGGKRLTISRLRQSIGIFLSEDGNLADVNYCNYIAHRMNHSYEVHRKFYNRYKSLVEDRDEMDTA